MITQQNADRIIRLLRDLESAVRKAARENNPDLIAARRIAADNSKQTGKAYQHFINGDYDNAFGVRTALDAIRYGRQTAGRGE